MMEIDNSHQIDANSSHALATRDSLQITSKVGQRAEETKNSGGDDENDNDPDSMTCPLFMDGLPRNFATNPQLAALASLIEDEDDPNEKLPKKHALSSTSRIKPVTHRKHVAAKHRNPRRRQRNSPYATQRNFQDEEKSTAKSLSVGEITLFMKMWKP